jgi:hypothetical protein
MLKKLLTLPALLFRADVVFAPGKMTEKQKSNAKSVVDLPVHKLSFVKEILKSHSLRKFLIQ